MRLKLFAVIGFVSAGLMACEQPGPPTPQIRSVRAVTVERRVISEPVVLIGQIRARNEISLAFRIDGKLIERPVAVGDRINVGHLVARLDPQDEKTQCKEPKPILLLPRQHWRRRKGSRDAKPIC